MESHGSTDRKDPQERVKETTLTERGETLATPGQKSLDHIARLITNLNESPASNQDFALMAVVNTQRVKARQREFMEFEPRRPL